ncbi:SDR family NAD(P)-dependent oxidoreductase [Microbacterium sp. MPKO10]|uniref:SDR family NAD(P)-dependent oxidoreductase n=1 Tax=Microbacterium sp. MPKO10 TaxID=2989818 RepID=UPI0022369838|nr:SDR family NAD(P)-dependent oxidoreductase [Microbacterium sp. MPKO10]MCW4458785.1 SDR family oxidoreductase [Microbacterium sp. MPKO10]
MAITSNLAEQVALVTGASGSIGAEVSRKLAHLGAAVAVHGRTQSVLNKLSAEIHRNGGNSEVYVGDARDPEHMITVATDVTRALGPINVLVALAGGEGAPSPTDSFDPERWLDVIDTDLNSVFYALRAVLPSMIEHGGGRIVTIASSAGRRPSKANAAYAAAKAGVVMLTEHIAKEYAHAHIRANCVAPSIAETTKLRDRLSAQTRDAIATSIPLGRIGQPSDIAEAIAFLATDRSSWITGTTVDITGGMTL